MGLIENYNETKNSIPEGVTLIAVSKTKPIEDIQALYNVGHRDFGENKVQELVMKSEQLPSDIRWHMIGHLQTNKIKYMADFVHLIHGVDKPKRLDEINKRAANSNRIQNVLLQIYIADENTKFGMSYEEAEVLLNSNPKATFPNINIKGFMGMATLTEDKYKIRSEFSKLKQFYAKIKSVDSEIDTLSMGMSGDYQMAIEEGSNMVRIGSAIFGDRNYN